MLGMKLWRFVGAGALSLVLAACGGGGGGAGCSVFDATNCNGTVPTSGNTVNATAVQVQFEPGAITNSGTDVAVANITVIGEGSRALAGVPVKLTLADAELASVWASTAAVDSATGNPVTNASGVVTAQVRVTKGSGQRSITLAAVAGTATGNSRLNVGASTTAAAGLLLTLSAPQIPNSVAAAVTVTATAVDGNRRTLAGIPITLSVDNEGTISQTSTLTGTDGIVNGTVRIGANRTNRIMKVKATSGDQTVIVDLPVKGAVLTASPAKSRLNFGEASSITFKLVDSAGAPMVGQEIVVTPAGVPAPLPVPPKTTITTDDVGEFKFPFTAPAASSGLAVITVGASAGGAQTLPTVIELSSAVVEPAKKPVVSGSVSSNPSVVAVNPVGETATNKVEIRALFLGSNNEPIQNVRAWFDLDGDKSSVGGTLESTEGRKFLYSDANGMVRTNYIAGSRFSPKDGVTVRVCYGENDFAYDFTVPTTVAPPCAKSATTRLTVVSDSLSVSIGSNALLEDGSGGINYVQRFAVQVVDSAGRAKSGVSIAPSIDLVRYYKGTWANNLGVTWLRTGNGNTYPTTYPSGVPVPAALLLADTQIPTNSLPTTLFINRVTVCDNEDLNRNGASETYPDQIEGLPAAEDQNNSLALGRPALDPRKADVTISVVGNDTTNADGVVVLKIEYPKNIASWVRYRILVSASVAGSEGRAVYDADLGVLASDTSNLQVPPPFIISPYGTQPSPTYPRQIVGGDVQYICTNPN